MRLKGDRPKLRHLAPIVQHDIKALFGNLSASFAADLMLLSLGNLEVMAERCKSSAIRGSDLQSGIGKKLSNSLWVHVSALDALDPLLRLYEGCASRTNMLRIAGNGRPEEATVVKFPTSKPMEEVLRRSLCRVEGASGGMAEGC